VRKIKEVLSPLRMVLKEGSVVDRAQLAMQIKIMGDETLGMLMSCGILSLVLPKAM
jgi:hypothetical protein